MFHFKCDKYRIHFLKVFKYLILYLQNGIPQGAQGGQLAQLIQQASPPLPVNSMSGSVGIPSQVAQQGPPSQGPSPGAGPGGIAPMGNAQGQPVMMQAGQPVPLQQSGVPVTPQIQSGDLISEGASPQVPVQENANPPDGIPGLPIPAVATPGEEGVELAAEREGENTPSGGKKKRSGKKKVKEPKKKDSKDAKTPKATRTPRKKKGKAAIDDSAEGDSMLEQLEGDDSNKGEADPTFDTKDSADGETADTEQSKEDKPKKEKKEKKPKTPRPKPKKKKKL